LHNSKTIKSKQPYTPLPFIYQNWNNHLKCSPTS